MEFNTLWQSMQTALGSHLPQYIGAVLVFIAGWFAAMAVRAAARKGLGHLKINERFGHATGQKVDVEGSVALILFWVVLLLVVAAVFNMLNLAQVSEPLMALTTQVFAYVPKLVGGLLLGLLAWLVASLASGLTQKMLDKTSLDEQLSAHANMNPVTHSLSNAVFWLVVLLFIPAILAVLQMQGLLDPLRVMMTKALDMLPNVFAALVIGGVGWIVATVLRNLTTNLLRNAGADAVSEKAGLGASVQLSALAGLLVFIVVFVPALIAALDALKIEAISKPATHMLGLLMDGVPHIVAASLILVITWMVASFATRLLARLLASLGFDTLPHKIGIAQAFGKTHASTLVGWVALAFAMLFATVEAANQLGFGRFSDMVSSLIQFGADVMLGTIIILAGFFLARVAGQAIERTGDGANTNLGLSRVVRFAIWGLVLAMGLRAMGIADDIVNLAFGLTLGSVAVVVALAFGLGGREAAGRLMDRWLEQFGQDRAGVAKAKPQDKRPPAA